MIGFASGTIPRIPLNLSLVKGNSIVGVYWGRFVTEDAQRSRHNSETIMNWVEAGRLRPVVGATFSLDEGAAALRWVADRKAIGRTVITI